MVPFPSYPPFIELSQRPCDLNTQTKDIWITGALEGVEVGCVFDYISTDIEKIVNGSFRRWIIFPRYCLPNLMAQKCSLAR
jgi:hypothetical protein